MSYKWKKDKNDNVIEEPVTFNTLKAQLEMPPGIISGSLASLMKSGRLERQLLTAEFGRKNIFGYVAKSQQKGVESNLESFIASLITSALDIA